MNKKIFLGIGLVFLHGNPFGGFADIKSQPLIDNDSQPLLAESPFHWRKEDHKAFGVGESILYVIKYGIIPAGIATLEIPHQESVNNRPAYYISSTARSNKTIDVFFKVRDKNESWMDIESLCSLQFHQKMREGRYIREVHNDYFHPQKKFIYWKKRKGKEYTEEGSIRPFVQDVLSSLYYVRTRDVEVGKSYTFHANSGGKNWPLEVHVKKIQKIRVPAGTFECLRVEPVMVGEGIFIKKGKLEIWLTNDEQKIPVLLRSRVLVGAFDAEMKSYNYKNIYYNKRNKHQLKKREKNKKF